MQIGGPPVGPHADRRHQVQPQQRQVDEVVARQRLVAQVRVHQPQAAEPAAAGADAADLGQVDARGVADEDVLDLAAPPDQDADLPLDLARDAAQVRRQLGRRDLRRTEPPPVNALQRVLLAGLEPRDIAADDVQGAEVSTAGDPLPRLRELRNGVPLSPAALKLIKGGGGPSAWRRFRTGACGRVRGDRGGHRCSGSRAAARRPGRSRRARSPAPDAGVAPGTPASANTDTAGNQPAVEHVFVVAMENQDANRIYGNIDDAPYINGTLLPPLRARDRVQRRAPGLPSEPHYVWMEAGTNAFADHTFTTDDRPSSHEQHGSGDHLVAQIAAAGGDARLAGVPGRHRRRRARVRSRAPASTGRGTTRSSSSRTSSGIRRRRSNANCAAHHSDLSALATISRAATSPATTSSRPISATTCTARSAARSSEPHPRRRRLAGRQPAAR